ncbi:MAG: DUF1553 domain-containing protein [Verrucomicrobia bacterium]|nr:MAG: DUF1553 domain-containing protein [Verrucomicrobiota bacterium]
MRTYRFFPLVAAALAWLGSAAPSQAATTSGKLDFNRDVRPVLNEHCFHCHGFDDKTRKGKLRLDVRDEALRGGKSGKAAIVPGKPDESDVFKRLVTHDADDLMPPAEANKPLSPAQIDLLKRWIAQGAEYKPHWAYIPPERPALPAVSNPSWPRNGIDHFVLSRIDEAGLKPGPEADRSTLIRRVSLDLTGLPPRPEEIDAFLADASPEAYLKVVDRLLASASYGERMAVDWMDAARYADTHGYHIDSSRYMTPWRDGVIRAFNENQRFDQFTLEQLAGDLLPNATSAQKVAAGFNRNHMINYEGGAVPDEYHAAYIFDRINTTATVWLGQTIACAQCHDHKYDPFTMRDYYALYAVFNRVPENGLDGSRGNAVPIVKLPSDEQERATARLDAAIRSAEAVVQNPPADVDREQRDWEASLAKGDAPEWTVVEPTGLAGSAGTTFARQDDGSWFASGGGDGNEDYTFSVGASLPSITALRIEALADDRLASRGPGRSGNGNLVLSEVEISAGGKVRKAKAASADHGQDGYPAANAIDGRADTGWGVMPQVGKSHWLVVEPAEPVVAVDGKATVAVKVRFQSGFNRHTIGRLRVSATASPRPHGSRDLPESVRAIAAIAPDQRTEAQRAELRGHFRDKVSATMRRLRDDVATRRKEQDDVERAVPTSMTMAEMEKPRDTFMLVRGQYDKKADKIGPAVPASLPPLDPGEPANRLGLARWLVSPRQPLTARVIVNRYWQMYFGNGLVKSTENFGTQGDWPTHPELLDWLATEFVRTGWDVKAMQRLIVTSATYRQDSRAPRPAYAQDPENRLLARGPRVRLQAEFLRDLALSAGGLLDPRVGGASVFPYQPAGLWEELMSREDNDSFTAQKYVASKGADLYRRTMYTFIKRTSPHPSLSTFDAPDRQVCTVKRPRTNTPLQALALMNDPTYVEAARKLAERMIASAPDDRKRIEFAFRLATGRVPRTAEIEVLSRLHREQLGKYRADAGATARLLSIGESKSAAGDSAELAAWTIVASAILNLDETLTKG